MPKISPRPETTAHPLYRETMAAQHIAYQLMRGVPSDRKADATRLHVACVHATTYVTEALDPRCSDRAEALQSVKASTADARRRLDELAAVAGIENEVAELETRLVEIEALIGEALHGPRPAPMEAKGDGVAA